MRGCMATSFLLLVGQSGIEPASNRYERSALPLSYKPGESGQRGRLRSCGLLLPKQALYQAELHAENWRAVRGTIPSHRRDRAAASPDA